jgi:hypothetical protein
MVTTAAPIATAPHIGLPSVVRIFVGTIGWHAMDLRARCLHRPPLASAQPLVPANLGVTALVPLGVAYAGHRRGTLGPLA